MESNNISGLIIDLRGNGGGYLTAASDIVSMFIEKNKVLYSLEGKDDTQTKKDQTDNFDYTFESCFL
jgi:carboxyl-terminal processing protease